MVPFALAKVIKKTLFALPFNAEYNNYKKLESVLGKCDYHGNGIRQMFTKLTPKDFL